MKTIRRNLETRKLIDEIQLARLRVARAESKWKLADKQAHAARRQRKEAKRAARRARKESKKARREFVRAQQALAVMEQRFSDAVERAVQSRKLALARLAARSRNIRRQRKSSPSSHGRNVAAKPHRSSQGSPAPALRLKSPAKRRRRSSRAKVAAATEAIELNPAPTANRKAAPAPAERETTRAIPAPWAQDVSSRPIAPLPPGNATIRPPQSL